MALDPALMIIANALQAQLEAVCAELGALEVSHRLQMEPRVARAAALQRELNEIKGVSK